MRPTACKATLRTLSLCLLAVSASAITHSQEIQRVPTVTFPRIEHPVIELAPPTGADIHSQIESGNGLPLVKPPANFQRLGDAHAGEGGQLHTVTLRFKDATKLTKITSNSEFHVEQGSSCVEGNRYETDNTCTLLIRFEPKGAGNRLGRVKIEHTASVTPFYVGLGGNGYAPVLSFVPAQLSTLTATYPAQKGLIKSSSSLSVDGGDTLYVADTGNNLIRSIDSSGKVLTVSSGTLSAPYSVVADNFGEVFFDEPAQNAIFEIFDYGSQFQLGGAGSDNCTTTTTCSINSEKIFLPGQMSIDPNNAIFMVEQLRGAMVAYAQPYPAQIAYLYDPFTFQNVNQGTVAVDAYDNIYSLWSVTNVCQILSEYFSDAANSHQVYKKVAGGKTCGFSGDGGPARNAEIGAKIPQMAFDVAGDLYFADTNNQRVRKIDAATGIITTIAGNGTQGIAGEGGQATLATLSNPTGVAVNSAGVVYVLTSAPVGGAQQIIRKIGPYGLLSFGGVARGVLGSTQTVTLTNTGNDTMTFTSANIIGANPTEFAIVPSATSCILTSGATLASGKSCTIGVSFKPAAAGTRTATLNFQDSGVTHSDSVLLTGVGVLPSATVAITSPVAGAKYTSGTAVPVKMTVTSATPAPTGTVTFSVDGANYGSPVTIASGAASISMTGLTTAAHTIGAIYNGDANHAASAKLTVAITVVAAATKPKAGPVRAVGGRGVGSASVGGK
jgi:hypothetical protein